MNSATSIKERSFRLKADATAGAKGQAQENSLRPMHFFVLASLMMATAAVVMSGPSTPEHLVLISLVVAAAGAAAAGFFRMLTPLTEPEPTRADAPLSERSRAVLEREKMLVLRSIKELEFDRAMGKVSPRDFDEMAGRLRARAIVLMKQIDDGATAYRDLIERELSARLATRTVGVAEPAERLAAAAVPEAPAGPMAAPGVCASCHTANDPDAAFCKRCGTRLEEAPGSAE
jgi:hypothetical protein